MDISFWPSEYPQPPLTFTCGTSTDHILIVFHTLEQHPIRHGVTKEHDAFKCIVAMDCCHNWNCAWGAAKQKIANTLFGKYFPNLILECALIRRNMVSMYSIQIHTNQRSHRERLKIKPQWIINNLFCIQISGGLQVKQKNRHQS